MKANLAKRGKDTCTLIRLFNFNAISRGYPSRHLELPIKRRREMVHLFYATMKASAALRNYNHLRKMLMGDYTTDISIRPWLFGAIRAFGH